MLRSAPPCGFIFLDGLSLSPSPMSLIKQPLHLSCSHPKINAIRVSHDGYSQARQWHISEAFPNLQQLGAQRNYSGRLKSSRTQPSHTLPAFGGAPTFSPSGNRALPTSVSLWIPSTTCNQRARRTSYTELIGRLHGIVWLLFIPPTTSQPAL